MLKHGSVLATRGTQSSSKQKEGGSAFRDARGLPSHYAWRPLKVCTNVFLLKTGFLSGYEISVVLQTGLAWWKLKHVFNKAP